MTRRARSRRRTSRARRRVDDAADGEQHLRDVRGEPGHEPTASCTSRTSSRTSSRSTSHTGHRALDAHLQLAGHRARTASPYVDGELYGATAAFAFALDAKTGKRAVAEHDARPEGASRRAAASLRAASASTSSRRSPNGTRLPLDRRRCSAAASSTRSTQPPGKTRWSFDTVTDPVGDKIIGGGAWNPPAIGPDGTVYIGTGNMYQPALGRHSTTRASGSTPTALLALDGTTGKLKWYFQAVPNDFHDWDLQLSPVYASAGGRGLVVDGREDGLRLRARRRRPASSSGRRRSACTTATTRTPAGPAAQAEADLPADVVEPGIVGGVETNMAVADGVVYVPVANLASEWKTRETGLGSANFGDGKGELLALDLDDGHVLWDTKLPQMADGDATVVERPRLHDHVRRLPGRARSAATGRIVWRQKLPAFTNAPVAIVGDTLITAASFPGGKGQTTEVIAFRLGAHGSFTPTPTSEPSRRRRGLRTARRCSHRTAPPATRWPPRTRAARSGRTSTSSSRRRPWSSGR